MPKLRISWVKSSIGYAKDQHRTLRALGFHRLYQVLEHEDSASVRGMVKKVSHLVHTEVINDGTT